MIYGQPMHRQVVYRAAADRKKVWAPWLKKCLSTCRPRDRLRFYDLEKFLRFFFGKKVSPRFPSVVSLAPRLFIGAALALMTLRQRRTF